MLWKEKDERAARRVDYVRAKKAEASEKDLTLKRKTEVSLLEGWFGKKIEREAQRGTLIWAL